jgi:cysteine desulfurase/selenocysteine lyase
MLTLAHGNLRKDFPLLNNGKMIAYLDNAATSQIPLSVVQAMNDFDTHYRANVHRGVYELSALATAAYEEAHVKVAGFVGCAAEEVVFTRNATEAINLVAYSYGMEHVHAGDNVVVSIMEHHSNFVPWQQLCLRKGASLRVVDVDETGQLDYSQLAGLIDARTRIVAVTQMSNVFGSVVDVQKVVDIAHAHEAVVVVDGAQSVAHMPVNFRELGCDFLAFSGHKMFGPTGIGVLVGRKELLESMQPFLFGGDMIKSVSVEETTWNELPWKFEAGTPNISGGIGLGTAVDYIRSIGMETIQAHERELGAYLLERLRAMNDVVVYGDDSPRGIVSFNLNAVHAHDVATILDSVGVCVRAGHHCCQPLMKRLGVAATLRVSLAVYNTPEDIDRFCAGLEKARRVFA